MFKIKNCRNGKFIRDAITGKIRAFETAESAQYLADSLRRSSVLDATAWNSVRPSNYEVLPFGEPGKAA